MLAATELTLILHYVPTKLALQDPVIGKLVLRHMRSSSEALGALCFVALSPTAAVLFFRAFQTLKLRPGIDRQLNDAEKESDTPPTP